MDRETSSEIGYNTLTELQIQVARRADELALQRPRGNSLNLHCWLVAEMEILGQAFSSPAPQLG
jgi:hypothetical protein